MVRPIHLALRGLRVVAPTSDLRLLSLGGACLLILVLLGDVLAPLWPARVLLGLIYVLFAPGYCLGAALFPHRDDISSVERIGLSFALSVAWTPPVALALHWSGVGLNQVPIILSELGSCLLFGAVAVWRRGRLAPDAVYGPAPFRAAVRNWRRFPDPDRKSLLGAFALLAAATLVAGIMVASTPDGTYTTEFYALGPDGVAENYPQRANVGEDVSILLGITNREREAQTYRVEAYIVNWWTGAQSEPLVVGEPILVTPGQTHEWPVVLQMPEAGHDQQVALWLYMEGSAEPYRRLRFWIDVEP